MLSAIVNAKIILEDSIRDDLVILFDERIVSFVESKDVDLSQYCPIDVKGAYLSAGFIDIHIHGSGGADVMDATPEALNMISKTILSTGTTAFLATTMTMSQETIERAIDNVISSGSSVDGAKVVGVHMEGPYINRQMCGAQDARYIQKPSLELIKKYSSVLKMITLAPEIKGAPEFIKEIATQYPDIVLSVGHSNATYEITKESFRNGVSHATHLGNAMSGFHHRAPGVLGAVMSSSEVTCDVIADFVHTHEATLELFWQAKKDKLILITDAMRAGCMRCGEYDLGGRRVVVKERVATLDDGTIAGSVLRLNEALANMLKATSMNLVDVVRSVTAIPAKKFGLDCGTLEVGKRADMVVFDESFDILLTIIDGKIKYTKGR